MGLGKRRRESSLLSRKPLRRSGTSPRHYTWSGSMKCRTHPATNAANNDKSGQIYTVRATYTHILPQFNGLCVPGCEHIGLIVLRLSGNAFNVLSQDDLWPSSSIKTINTAIYQSRHTTLNAKEEALMLASVLYATPATTTCMRCFTENLNC